MLPTPFQPSPAQKDQILAALANPAQSLTAIAHDHNTDTQTLLAWLETDTSQALFQSLSRITRTRLELITADQLLTGIAAAHHLLKSFTHDESTLSTNPTTQAKRESQLLDHRARATAMRAANFLLRASNPPPPRGRGPGDRFAALSEPATSRPTQPTEPHQRPDPAGRGAADVSCTGRKPGESDSRNHPATKKPANSPRPPSNGEAPPKQDRAAAPTGPAPDYAATHNLTINDLLEQASNPTSPPPHPQAASHARTNHARRPSNLASAAGGIPAGP